MNRNTYSLKLIIGSLLLIISSTNYAYAQFTLKPVIGNVKPKTPKPEPGHLPSEPKPKIEKAYATVKVLTDLDGTIYYDRKPYKVSAGQVLFFPIYKNSSFYFLSEDEDYYTNTQGFGNLRDLEHFRGDTIVDSEKYDFLVKERYLAYLRNNNQTQIDNDVLYTIKNNFVKIPLASNDFLKYTNIYFAKTEVTVAQFALFQRKTQNASSNKTNSSNIVDTSVALKLKRKNKVGVNWEQDAIGNPIQNIMFSNHPVVNVSWEEAKAYCAWLSNQDLSYDYRLPTKKEWLYYAQCGTSEHKYPWGNNKEDFIRTANTRDQSLQLAIGTDDYYEKNDDGYAFTSPVATFNANCLGIFDLGGNVAEWLEDEFTDFRITNKENAPKRQFIGGSYFVPAEASNLEKLKKRTSKSQAMNPNERHSGIGFRLVKVPK